MLEAMVSYIPKENAVGETAEDLLSKKIIAPEVVNHDTFFENVAKSFGISGASSLAEISESGRSPKYKTGLERLFVEQCLGVYEWVSGMLRNQKTRDKLFVFLNCIERLPLWTISCNDRHFRDGYPYPLFRVQSGTRVITLKVPCLFGLVRTLLRGLSAEEAKEPASRLGLEMIEQSFEKAKKEDPETLRSYELITEKMEAKNELLAKTEISALMRALLKKASSFPALAEEAR